MKSRCVCPLTKSLFRFLLAQLVAPSAGLAHPEHALYKDAVYILESLSTVKSVVLVCDLPSGNDIMTEYFEKLWAMTEYVRRTNADRTLRKMSSWP